MTAIGRSAAVALTGVTGSMVYVEASLNDGIPTMDVVGLPDTAVNESRQRIRTALSNSGFTLPSRRITVNLSPGTVRKVGTGFDLSIAMAVLAATTVTSQESTAATVHLGELSLDGRLRPIRGVLPALVAAKAAGHTRFVVPLGNLGEAQLIDGIDVRGAATLTHVAALHGADVAVPDAIPIPDEAENQIAEEEITDLATVYGQHEARWALEVAAAGGHHLLMIGAPGAGKTLLAECLPGILPDLSREQAAEVATVESVDGAFSAQRGLNLRPPFQAPHHKTTSAALVGAARSNRIGLMARAHHGVLFLDEAPEFSRDVLEVLRQPLESGSCTVHRAWGAMTVPARFQLVLAANPCPCGQAVGRGERCRCTPLEKRRYLHRLSGPLLDRVDLQIEMLPVSLADVHAKEAGEASAVVAERVRRARAIQRDRYRGCRWHVNAQANGEWLREHFDFTRADTADIDRALDKGLVTMRGYDRVLRVGTTIADLRGHDRPGSDDLLAALLLRVKERS